MNLSAKRKAFLKKLFGGSNSILSAMSSEYCDDDEPLFKETYGLSFKEAQAAIEAFVYHINHL